MTKTTSWPATMDHPLGLFSSSSREATPGLWLLNTLRSTHESPAVCYLLDERRRFIYCNPAWDRFARENDAPHLTGDSVLATDLFAAIPDVLSDVYARAFERAGETGRIWSKLYQCSSAETFRRFRMRIYPVKRLGWFLVSNTVVVERRHSKMKNPADETYVSGGVVMMCAHCRSAKRTGTPERWDFVPAYLRLRGKDSFKVSHGLCPICAAYFYPGL